jgi:hypothetical protein
LGGTPQGESGEVVRRLAAALCTAALVSSAPAAAQTVSRPGPWVIDVRGVTSPIPGEAAFYPPLDATALIPGRGFGLDIGGHVYLFNIGASRLGIGLNVVNLRATTKPPPAATGTSTTPAVEGQSVAVDLRSVAPQISFNFGSRDGWSYLSVGAGTVGVIAKTSGIAAARRESDRLNALNVGGGARWFLKSHLAFGFDVRMHRIAAGSAGTVEQDVPSADGVTEPTPAKMILMVGAGFSFR